MPTDYAGSSYIGVDPYRSGVRKGVEYEEDDEMQRWAEEHGKLAKRGGATTFKIYDPTAPGGYRYTLRSADQYSGPGGEGTQVTINNDGKEVLAEAMGQTAVMRPRLTKSQAQSFKTEYQKDMAEQERRAEELRRKAEADAEAKRLSEQRIAEARAMGELGVELEGKKRQMFNTPDMQTPQEKAAVAAAGLATAQIGQQTKAISKDEERESKREQAVAQEVLMPETDIPGLSERGEAALRAASLAGRSADEAFAVGEQAHQEDVAEIQRLESSGNPDSISKAAQMRQADPDLKRLRSFLPERNRAQEQLTADILASEQFSGLRGNEGIEEGSAFTSFLKAPITGIPRYLSTTGAIEQSVPKLRIAVQKLMLDNPGMTRQEAAAVMTTALVNSGVPMERVSKVMSGI